MAPLGLEANRRRENQERNLARAAQAVLARRSEGRLLVAVAGPPGAGKSSFAQDLRDALERRGEAAVVVPMDGFHLDNAVLAERGLMVRKGAPETFDPAGFGTLLERIAADDGEVVFPIFDREADLARAGGAVLPAATRIVLIEGNYLLLDENPWRDFLPLFGLSIYLEVGRDELERRLVRRWLKHGLDASEARARALSNDIPNAQRISARRLAADLVLR